MLMLSDAAMLILSVGQHVRIRVYSAGTSLTSLFGVGPVTAATVIGDVRHVGRFASRDAFAAWNGTAPIEVSSGQRKVHRLSRRGNRRVSHAVHMAAVTQVSHRHSRGRAYYDKKLAEGKTPKEALRALKRQVSDAIYAALLADARRAAARTAPGGPGRAAEDGSVTSVAGSHPRAPALRAGHSRTRTSLRPRQPRRETPLLPPFPAQLPVSVRAGRPGQRPGAARPRSGARRASLTRQPASR
jgi:hypothetical protein